MSQTRGFAAPSATSPLAPYSFERREPGDRDVAIDIKYCGICHSDIHQARDEWGGGIFPMVPGHEIAGIVTRVGPKVTKFKPGDKVGVGCFVDSCGRCPECRQDMEQYCSILTSWTYNGLEQDRKTPTYGGYSEKIVVDEHFVLRLPELPLDAAAPLLCAGITLYSPLKRWQTGPGKRVAILGLGGLGHIGIKLAHAMGAEVTVLSHSAKKEADAKRMGADQFVATSSRDAFRSLNRYFDLIISTVSVELDWNQFLGLLRVNGTLCVVGLPPSMMPIAPFSLIAGGKGIAGSGMGGIKETQEMLDFCGEHNIVCDIETIPIQQVNEAYDRVVKSDVRYRFVIDLATL